MAEPPKVEVERQFRGRGGNGESAVEVEATEAARNRRWYKNSIFDLRLITNIGTSEGFGKWSDTRERE
jgi:hypothetical protein